MDQHGSSVDQEPTITDLDSTEARHRRVRLDDLALGVEELGDDPIAGRRLGAPRLDGQRTEFGDGGGTVEAVGVDDRVPSTVVAAAADRGGHRRADATPTARLQLHPDVGRSLTDHVRRDAEVTPAGVGVVVSDDDEVVDAVAPPRLEHDRPVDPRVEPVVLVLDPGGVAPADDHGRELVLAPDEMRRQIELRGQPRVLAHSDEVTVAPDEQHALGPADRQHDLPATPRPRHPKGRPVEAGRIVVGNVWRFDATPGHLDVGVDRQIGLVLARPDARHGDLVPRAVALARLIPPTRRGGRAVDELEPPLAVEGTAPR